MSKILNTQNAEITTVVVAVETITISGRQVTQSVFKQLLDAPLFHANGHMLGTPWGIVNYCPDSTCQRSKREERDAGPLPWHLHVVWQKGAALRRCTIWVITPHVGWGDRPVPGIVAPSRAAWDELTSLPHLFIAV